MPAPKNPNMKPAHDQRRANAAKRKQESMADGLTEDGWLPLNPLDVADLKADRSDAYIAGYIRAALRERTAANDPEPRYVHDIPCCMLNPLGHSRADCPRN